MNMHSKLIILILFLGLVISSCKRKDPVATVENIVKEWKGKEINFPDDLFFTIYGKDTVPSVNQDKQYKILMYIDSIGCTSCKLKIEKWKEFIEYLEPLMDGKIDYLFFFHPQRTGVKKLKAELYSNGFSYPVCFDLDDKLNKLNQFPQESDFQTFLLDKNNQVLVIGNPVNNSAIKELYLEILLDRKPVKHATTQIDITKSNIDLGQIEQDSVVRSSVILHNTGNSPFVILGADVSCRCVEANFDKTPVQPDQKREIVIEYTPKDKGQFHESIVIRGNIPNPVKLSIRGEVTGK